MHEGSANRVDLIHGGEIKLGVNAPLGRRSPYDEKAIEKAIRLAALERGVPWVITIQGAAPSAMALSAGGLGVTAPQDAPAATALPLRP